MTILVKHMFVHIFEKINIGTHFWKIKSIGIRPMLIIDQKTLINHKCYPNIRNTHAYHTNACPILIITLVWKNSKPILRSILLRNLRYTNWYIYVMEKHISYHTNICTNIRKWWNSCLENGWIIGAIMRNEFEYFTRK